jgi:ELWxxDGT repeat protein
VGVVQARRGLGLVVEALELPGIQGCRARQYIEGYDANGQSPDDYELWSSDGTAANTAMVTDINTTIGGANVGIGGIRNVTGSANGGVGAGDTTTSI